jgi:hypothetical protein
MDNNTSPQTEVLHSENHSKLTDEEIAKAVARHNREHSGGGAAPAHAEKPKKGKKS